MRPNCSSCNKAVTFGFKINEVSEWVEGQISAFKFWDFFLIPPTLVRLPGYQFLVLTMKPIHYPIILQAEASFRHHHPSLNSYKRTFSTDAVESAVALGAMKMGFTTFICCCMLNHNFF